MQRKTTTAPARVYTYGCSYRGIITNDDRADEQYRLAHAYREKLVDIELTRRQAVRAILTAAAPVELETAVTTLAAEMDATMLAVRMSKQASRSPKVPPELKAKAGELRGKLRGARLALKAAKRIAAYGSSVQSALAKTTADYRASIKDERGRCGVYWGTYLIVEKAAEMQRAGTMDPQHRPYTGDGRIAVQLQGGLGVGALATDTRLQIVPMAPVRPDLPQPKVQKRHLCRLRIGTQADGRTPLWAEIEVIIHRPLPEDSRITWAWLQRIRRGRHFIYNLQITLESKTFVAIPTGKRRVSVDLGWRVSERGAGGLRVAYWRDSDGAHGEVRLPLKMLSAIDYPSQLLGVEDRHFEAARAVLVEWLAAHPAPAEHVAETQNLVQWRSGRRLAGYVWWWREHRFAGDEEIYAQMNTWRVRRFWHYRDWSMHQRDKALASRKDFYRCAAQKILAGCSELVLEDFDLRVFARKSTPDVVDPQVTAQRYWRAMGAPSELRLCLVSAAKKLGIEIVKTDPAMTTRRCHVCGVEVKWDQAREIVHTCASCGAQWDQDLNACVNLLASGPVTPNRGEALASATAGNDGDTAIGEVAGRGDERGLEEVLEKAS